MLDPLAPVALDDRPQNFALPLAYTQPLLLVLRVQRRVPDDVGEGDAGERITVTQSMASYLPEKRRRRQPQSPRVEIAAAT